MLLPKHALAIGFVLTLFMLYGCTETEPQSSPTIVDPEINSPKNEGRVSSWTLFINDDPIAILSLKESSTGISWSGQVIHPINSHCNGINQLMDMNVWSTLSLHSSSRIDFIQHGIDSEFSLLGDNHVWTDWVYADDCEALSGKVERVFEQEP